jgi:hypothetical protein
MDLTRFDAALRVLPEGSCDVIYRGRRYLLRKATCLKGRLIKCYAEELGGNDFISLNYYPTLKIGGLKPCEMAPEKVVDFVEAAVVARPQDSLRKKTK